MLIHAPVYAAAARQLHRVAVVSDEGTLSYTRLVAGVESAAHMMRAAGIAPGDLLAVHGVRSQRLVIALLAALRVGAAFLVLDAAAAPGYLSRILATSRPRALLRCDVERPLPDGLIDNCMVLDFPDISSASPASRPIIDDAGGADPAAYLVFTSGTTDRPRGVLGTHGPVFRYLSWSIREFGFGPGDRFALLASVGHDPFLREMLTPLWVGATMHIPSPREWASPPAMVRWLARSECAVVNLTPTLARRLVAAGGGAMLPEIRLVCLYGEPTTWSTVTALTALMPRARIVNCYGTTETPQVVAFYDASAAVGHAHDPAAPVPIGRGIPGVELRILRPDDIATNEGEDGEVYVYGEQLAVGYHDDDALTASRFVALDGADGRRCRAFRTGDRGSVAADGTVILYGRLDRQVKISGYRVEPAAVETYLRRISGVADAAVVPVTAGPSGAAVSLRAVVVTNHALTEQAIRSALVKQLPLPAIPGEVLFTAELPATRNGKLDMARLSGPTGVLAPSLSSGVLDEVERRVAAALAAVVGEEVVSPDADFFELGGDSLAAIELSLRLAEEFGQPVDAQEVFVRQTVAGLADLFRSGQLRAGWSG